MSLLLNNNVGYSIVGTPTIVDGILSNTDINNYIKTTSQIDFSTEFNLEFYVRFKTPSSLISGFQTIISTGNWDTPLLALTGSTYYYIAGYGGDAFQTQLALNTYYRAKLVRKDETTWQTFVYNDNGELLTTSEQTKTITYTNKNILFGCPYGSASPVIPEIVLKDCYIKVNGITWFNGKQTQSTSIQDIKFNNNVGYEIVGSPTINNGVVSGFSDNNYLFINQQTINLSNIVFYMKFTTGSLENSNLETIAQIATTGGALPLGFYIQNKQFACFYSGTNNNNIYTFVNQTLSPNTTYEAEFKTVNSVRSLKFGPAGNMQDITLTQGSDSDFEGSVSKPIQFGNGYPDLVSQFTGSIDLNNTYIKVNGITWFNGKQTASADVNYVIQNGGEVGYNIVGTPTIVDGIIYPTTDVNSYIKASSNLTFNSNSDLEMYCRFKTNEEIPSNNNIVIIGDSVAASKMFCYYYSGWVYFLNLAFDNYTWRVVQPNTWYRAKLTAKNGVWKSYVYDDNENLLGELQSTPTPFGDVTVTIPFGKAPGYESGQPVPGGIDLNNTYIKVNGNYFFNGASKLIWANPNIYLQSDSNSYIDTGLIGKGNSTTIDFAYMSSNDDMAIFGARQTSGSNMFEIAQLVGTGGRFDYNNISTSLGFSGSTKHICKTKIDGANYVVERYNSSGVLQGSYNFTLSNFQTPYTLDLFARNNNGTVNAFSTDAKIYYFKIYEDGVLVRHFIPIPANFVVGGGYKTPSAGMFDIVEQKFYPNLGTGSFTYGKD